MSTSTEKKKLTGAQAILKVAASAGLKVCFANPGTTELSLVQALDQSPEIHPVLAVFIQL